MCFSLSNLFYGLDERSPLRADLYVSMVKLAQQADLVPQLAINIEQVLVTCLSNWMFLKHIIICAFEFTGILKNPNVLCRAQKSKLCKALLPFGFVGEEMGVTVGY